MPEGDTIHKVANAIAPLLEGERLTGFRLREDRNLDLRGQRITRVEARGKHLFVTFDNDLVLRTHLGMHGAWHRYAPGEAWKRPERQASVVLETTVEVIVCFNAQEIECFPATAARTRKSEGRIGPDLLAEGEPDYTAIIELARKRLDPSTSLVDLLLNQAVASGIGNVYKCELLFLHELHPMRKLESVDDGKLVELYRSARDLLQRNLGGGPRTTRFADDGAGRAWVYKRGQQACFRCSQEIQRARMGRGERVTYWCAGCQR